jgi:hypothetical protein
MEYNLNGKVSLDDYVQFNKTHKRHGFYKIFRLIIYPALIIIIALILIPEIETLKDILMDSPLYFIKTFSPVIVFIICLILFNSIGMRLIYKKHYNANKLLQQTISMKINEQFISIAAESGTSNLTKKVINKIIYDKDSIYIYIGLNMAYILKKRFLENENNFEDLVRFVRSNYEKK